MNLKDKKVLVTGASSGIGQAIAIALAEKGAEVFIHYHKNKEGAEKTLAEVTKHSSGKIIQADLMFPDNAVAMFKEIDAPLDCLVNNAGDAKGGDFFQNDIWAYEFANIFFSAVYCSRNFLQQDSKVLLRKIVNIASIYGNLEGASVNIDYAAYSAAKAALENLTVTLAKQGKEVLVNAIAPGRVKTPAWGEMSDQEIKEETDDAIIKRFIKPEEIAHSVIYLLENDAVTGQVLTVDGGILLKAI